MEQSLSPKHLKLNLKSHACIELTVFDSTLLRRRLWISTKHLIYRTRVIAMTNGYLCTKETTMILKTAQSPFHCRTQLSNRSTSANSSRDRFLRNEKFHKDKTRKISAVLKYWSGPKSMDASCLLLDCEGILEIPIPNQPQSNGC